MRVVVVGEVPGEPPLSAVLLKDVPEVEVSQVDAVDAARVKVASEPIDAAVIEDPLGNAAVVAVTSLVEANPNLAIVVLGDNDALASVLMSLGAGLGAGIGSRAGARTGGARAPADRRRGTHAGAGRRCAEGAGGAVQGGCASGTGAGPPAPGRREAPEDATEGADHHASDTCPPDADPSRARTGRDRRPDHPHAGGTDPQGRQEGGEEGPGRPAGFPGRGLRVCRPVPRGDRQARGDARAGCA
jgi:hypothetical protein